MDYNPNSYTISLRLIRQTAVGILPRTSRHRHHLPQQNWLLIPEPQNCTKERMITTCSSFSGAGVEFCLRLQEHIQILAKIFCENLWMDSPPFNVCISHFFMRINLDSRISFKTLLYVYKSLNGLCPRYIDACLTVKRPCEGSVKTHTDHGSKPPGSQKQQMCR